MSNKNLAHRVLSQRLPVITDQVVQLSEQLGLKVEVSSEMSGEIAQISVRGVSLLTQQFGDQENQATAPLGSLLQSLGQIRRQFS